MKFKFFSRSYYLLVALSREGFLIFQEDREGAVFSTTVQDRSFINGARHFVYYRRDGNDSELYVDKELVPMVQIPAQTFNPVAEMGANEVQIGGHNTSDPRFAIYKAYSGCLSSNFKKFYYKSVFTSRHSFGRYIYRGKRAHYETVGRIYAIHENRCGKSECH